MKKIVLSVIIVLFALLAFKKSDQISLQFPSHWPKPNFNFTKSPLSKEKIELGRALFYDPVLSRDSSTSCASCHSQYTAFTHADHSLSHGIENRIGTRNSPTLMNLAWNKLFMWDGAVNHIEVQALAPISNPLEMDEKIDHVVTKLQKSRLYPKLFYQAFNDSNITGAHTLKAIAQFMLTFVSCNSKYDSVMQKKASFTSQEQNGYRIFKQNCSSCHTEPFFTNNNFENNGLAVDPTLNDPGRYKISKNPSDSLKFKVPTLRNIEFSSPYMHDGRFKKLSEVLNHYAKNIIQSKTLAAQLRKPIALSANEKVDLTAFLLTLTDKQFLFDKKYAYPREIFTK